MLLKTGITGFFEQGDDFLEESSYSDFRKLCYGFRDKQWVMAGTCNRDDINYYYAQWNVDGQGIYLLQNKYYPILAFTRGLRQNEKVFINPPDSFSTYCEVVAAKILNEPWDENTDHLLSKAELHQIRYWKPVSIGNIIFNEWD